ATMYAAAPSGNLFPQFERTSGIQAPARDDEITVERQTSLDRAEILPPGDGGVLSGDLRETAPAKLAGLSRVSVGVERTGEKGGRVVGLEAEYRDGRRTL